MVPDSDGSTLSRSVVLVAARRATALMALGALWTSAGCLRDSSAVFACTADGDCAPGFVCDAVARVCVRGGATDTSPDAGAETETDAETVTETVTVTVTVTETETETVTETDTTAPVTETVTETDTLDLGWPAASHGLLDRVIDHPVTIPAGTVLQYRNLTITSDGELEILGPSLAWTVIGVSGTLTLEGRIKGSSGETANAASAHEPIATDCPEAGTSCTLNDLHGDPLSWTPVQRDGGPGDTTSFEPAAAASGNGGGGEGGAKVFENACLLYVGRPGEAATEGGGGAGGRGFDQSGAPGAGARTFGGAGEAGEDGGGGGGGKRGRHGQLLYIQVLGEVAGSGEVDLTGENGGPGGAAKGIHGCQSCVRDVVNRGFGGGGGAGGNGGKLVRRGAPWPYTITVKNGGGLGGAGGEGGPCDGPRPDSNGADGDPGTE